MPKRQRAGVDSDSDAFSESLSQDSDFSIFKVPKLKKASRTRKNTRTTRQIALKGSINEATPSGSATTPSHSASIHVVTTSRIDEIRESLLEWYNKVHDVRGMPWRKRYDPLLGREGRAQRAYEARISSFSQTSEVKHTCGHRFGYPKLCYSRPKS